MSTASTCRLLLPKALVGVHEADAVTMHGHNGAYGKQVDPLADHVQAGR